MNDLIVQDQSYGATSLVSISEIAMQAKAIQELLKGVMQKGTHYDVIPGTKNNTLLKPGAEKILSMFRIGTRLHIDDLSTKDEIRYRITCEGFYIPTGNTVGYGVGECSSSEEKYKWRAAVCDDEYDATAPDRRRIKWAAGWGERRGERIIKETKQVRTEPPDLANTVLKMAKKRAMSDLTLTATAASDIFTQDLEDLDETLREHLVRQGNQEPAGDDSPKDQTVATPKRSSDKQRPETKQADGTAAATSGEKAYLTKKIEDAGLTREQVMESCGVSDWDNLTKDGFTAMKDSLLGR
jgi:hypothetical protein